MRLIGALLLAFSATAAAHVVSMSTGEAKLSGSQLDYELRMPMYEVAHMRDPETQVFENIQFRWRGAPARLIQHSCHQESGNLVCSAAYSFAGDPDQLDVECSFPSITVPNHIHLLRAVHGDKSEQAAFDASFPATTIRFRPPTALETGLRDMFAGFWRASAGLVQILFLGALVLAARSRRELLQLVAMFLAGQGVTTIAHLSTRLQVSPRFIEAATALTVAYLAFEILMLPQAGQRWLVVGVLGLLHGMYFDMLLAAGDYGRVPFLAGVFGAEIAIVSGLALLARMAALVPAMRSTLFARAMASVLLMVGISWFLMRLKS